MSLGNLFTRLRGDGAISSSSSPEQQEARAEIVLRSRYTRDLSFENIAAPPEPLEGEPLFDISVAVDCRHHEALHEVTLSTTITASHEDRVIFVVEISYAGLFDIPDMPGEARERFIYTEAPRILFPFVDRIASDVTRDGGLPPLSISPPDFVALHNSASRSQRQSKR